LAEEILSDYQHIIDELTFIMSSGGAYEVRVNDELIYSKKTIQRRHAEPGEIMGMFRKIVGPNVPTYPKSDG
jgi:predicted Rdx family selenoprotein